MSETIVDILIQSVNFVSCFETCFVYYIGLRPRKLSKAAAWTAASMMLFFGSALFKFILGLSLPVYTGWMFALNAVVMTVIYHITVKSFFLWVGIQYIAVTLPAEAIAVSLTKIILKKTYAETYVMAYASSEFTIITRLLVNITMMVLIVFLLIGKALFTRMFHGWKNYILFLSIPVYQTLLVAGLFSVCSAYLTVPITVAGHMIAVFSILIDFAVIIVIENMNERIDREEELSGLETMRKQELAYLEWDVQQTEAVRLVRHDLGNQLQTLSAMMEDNGDRNRVRVMLEEIMQKVNRVNPGAEDNGNV